MSFNPQIQEGYIYIVGREDLNGSKRISIDLDTEFTEIQKRVDGIWQPAALEVGTDSLWCGPNVGIAGIGHHLVTESSDGHLHFLVHNEFDGETSTKDAQTLYAYSYLSDIPIQPDDSTEWSGNSLKFDITPQGHSLLDVLSVKTGSISATEYIRLIVRTGNPDTGTIILDQKYPASYFTANTTVDLSLAGCVEFEAGVDFYFEYSSDSTFSLKTNSVGDWPWAMISYSAVREDNLLQTAPWEDGDSWNSGDYIIYSRKIYICNTTGSQSGTFVSNSDKWDLIGTAASHSHTETDPIFTAWDKDVADMSGMVESRIPFGTASGGLQGGDFLKYDGDLKLNYGDFVVTRGSSNTIKTFMDSTYTDLRFGGGKDYNRIGTWIDKPLQIVTNSIERVTIGNSGSLDAHVGVNTPLIRNSDGNLDIQPYATGNVEFFDVTDVGDGENGKMVYINRKAPEGNDYIRFYISSGRTGYIHGSPPNGLYLQGQADMGVKSVTDDVIIQVGDSAGVKKIKFKNSDGDVIAELNSRGSLDVAEINTTVNGVYSVGDIEAVGSVIAGNDLVVGDDIYSYGDISTRNNWVRGSLVFQDKSTQEEAGERHFSQGHTHTAIYNNDWYDAGQENMSERDIHFSPDGLKMYIIGLAGNGTGDCSIWEFPLTTPWDLSTVGSPTIESIESYGSNQVGMCISKDGRRLWTVCTSTDMVIEYAMSPWNISALTWVQEKDISGQETSPSAIFWSANGDRLFVAGDADNDIVAFSVSNEWDISGISWFEDFGTDINAPTGLHFSSDGRRMYVMDGSAEDDIHEFHLSSPWMISTARLVNLFNVSTENSSPQGIFITPDNSKIFMVGTGTPDGVYDYNLGLEVGGTIISNNGAIRPGSITTTQRDALTPTSGDVIFNTTDNKHQGYNGSIWNDFY